MLGSKIWVIFLSAVATAAVSAALLTPRASLRLAERQQILSLELAQRNVELLLQADGDALLGGALRLAQDSGLADTLLRLSPAGETGGAAVALAAADPLRPQLRDQLATLVRELEGSFAVALGPAGQVLVGAGPDLDTVPRDASKLTLVSEALLGTGAADVLETGGTLYVVAALPVRRGKQPPVAILLLGRHVDDAAALRLRRGGGLDDESAQVEMAIFVRARPVASSSASASLGEIARLLDGNRTPASQQGSIIQTMPGKQGPLLVSVAPVPSRSSPGGAQLVLFAPQPRSQGVGSWLAVLAAGGPDGPRFPWWAMLCGLCALVVLGLALLHLEAERPLRRLAEDVRRIPADSPGRLPLESYHGEHAVLARALAVVLEQARGPAGTRPRTFGGRLSAVPEEPPPLPIAGRSIDERPAPLLGLRPEAAESEPSLVPMAPLADDAVAGSAAGPAAMAADGGAGAMASAEAGTLPSSTTHPLATPPSMAAAAPVAAAMAGSPGSRISPPPAVSLTASRPRIPAVLLDGPESSGARPAVDFGGETVVAEASEDLIRATLAEQASPADREAQFREVFEAFLETRRSCGESVDGLTYERFAKKLRTTRAEVLDKVDCRDVRFQVYVKEGRAVLKAIPRRQS